jgi:hypothetical protein
MDQNVKIRVGQGDTRCVKTGRGVTQGYCFRRFYSSYVYSEYRAKVAVAGTGDFKIGGKVIRFMRNADGLVLLAKKEPALQRITARIIDVKRRYGMEMNVEKNKVMKIRIKGTVRDADYDRSKTNEGCGLFQIFW